MNEFFRRFATKIAAAAGNPWAFMIALAIIVGWAIAGPTFDYSNTWQLFINTFTTIVTLLMVFLIQNTQNRDSKAVHLKLDELLKGIHGARNKMVNIEELPDEVLDDLHEQFRKLQSKSGKLDETRNHEKKAKKHKKGGPLSSLSKIPKLVEKPLVGKSEE